ncbi:hypothetical protein GJ496_000307 [Pomphorhynchus laevis]|nr:hypothetical protein GJ496_000307 [Pomphorhynchus laevis]
MGDGTCLFRSLSDQMIGESNEHLEFRNQKSVMTLSKPGTFAGNKTLNAFARIYSVDIVIHQLNQSSWRIRSYFNSDHVFAGTQQLSLHHRHRQSMLLVSEAADSQVNKISNRSLSQKDLTQASRKSKDGHEFHICYHSYPHYSSVRLIGDAQ